MQYYLKIMLSFKLKTRLREINIRVLPFSVQSVKVHNREFTGTVTSY